MAPKFGTSGLRGLADDLTPELVGAYLRGFVAACPTGGAVWLGRDLRASSPRIAEAAARALRDAGVAVRDAGILPTPALAMAARAAGEAAVMITGSHIPADRNGLKFYRPDGEIDKADEAAILEAVARSTDPVPGRSAGTSRPAGPDGQPGADRRWADRARRAWGPAALAGWRIGVWQQSSVARDLLPEILADLGAEPVPLDRSDAFVPVDTEAVDAATRARLAGWVAGHRLDALVSTDGDADRPLVVDERGAMVPGDVLGPLAARALGARTLVAPVSANGLVDAMGGFEVVRTRIGSPHVIAGMAGRDACNGYEPNGGLILGFAAQGPAGPLPALPTRDSLVPIVAPLAAARAAGLSLSALVAALPARFTASDRIAGIDPGRAAALLDALRADPAARAALAGGPEAALDLTDGLRMTRGDGRVVHLRPSSNAPEFRVYCEAEDPEEARAIVDGLLARLASDLTG